MNPDFIQKIAHQGHAILEIVVLLSVISDRVQSLQDDISRSSLYLARNYQQMSAGEYEVRSEFIWQMRREVEALKERRRVLVTKAKLITNEDLKA